MKIGFVFFQIWIFLVACTQLYQTLCWSIGWSVLSNFWLRILLFQGLQRLITAPVQPHATEIAVFTALFDYTPSMMSLLSIINNEIIKKFGFHRLIGAKNQCIPSIWHFLYQIPSFSPTLYIKIWHKNHKRILSILTFLHNRHISFNLQQKIFFFENFFSIFSHVHATL